MLLVAAVATGAAWFFLRAEMAEPTSAGAREAAAPAQPEQLGAQLEGHAQPGARRQALGRNEAAPPAAEEGKANAGDVLRVRVSLRGAPNPPPPVTVLLRADTEHAPPARTTPLGADGTATFTGVDLRTAVVEARAQGFRIESRVTRDLADEILELELEPGVPFEGWVVDAQTAAAVEGASVVVHDWAEVFEVGPTDEHGRYRVPGVMNDHAARVAVGAPGYALGSIEVQVQDGKPPKEVPTVRLRRGGSLLGIVLTPDGKPAAGATLIASDPVEADEADEDSWIYSVEHFEFSDSVIQRDPGPHETTTGSDGTFRLDGLQFDGDFRVSATAPGYGSAAPIAPLRLTASSAERTVTLSLRKPAVALVRVVVPEGATLPAEARIRLFQDERLHKPAGRESDGRYRFDAADPGFAYAFVQAEGFRTTRVRIDLREGETVEAELAPEVGATVSGVVVDEQGNPLADAEVNIAALRHNRDSYRRTGYLSLSREGKTDSAGRFTIGGLAPEESVLVVTWGDWRARRWLATRERVRVSVPARDVRVVLASLGGLRMRLLTPDGKPLVGKVWASVEDRPGSRGGTSDVTDGVVEETQLEAGDFWWIVRPPDHAWIRKVVTLRAGERVDFGDVVLDPGVTVSGQVLDNAGRPVPGAIVTCSEVNGRSTTTDSQGRWSLERFPREPFSFNVSAEGFLDAGLSVEPAKTTNLVVRLSRPVTLRGVVKNSAGALLPDCAVTLRRPGAILRHGTWTGPDGKQNAYEYYDGDEGLESDLAGHIDDEVSPGAWIGYWYDEAAKQDVRVGEWTFADGETRVIEIVIPTK